MSLQVVSFRLSESILDFLRESRFSARNYDELVNKLLDECEKVINKVDDFIPEPLTVQTFKLKPETVMKLDMTAKRHKMNRSELFRKLVLTKAKKIC